jgi:hypothetical protein
MNGAQLFKAQNGSPWLMIGPPATAFQGSKWFSVADDRATCHIVPITKRRTDVPASNKGFMISLFIPTPDLLYKHLRLSS